MSNTELYNGSSAVGLSNDLAVAGTVFESDDTLDTKFFSDGSLVEWLSAEGLLDYAVSGECHD